MNIRFDIIGTGFLVVAIIALLCLLCVIAKADEPPEVNYVWYGTNSYLGTNALAYINTWFPLQAENSKGEKTQGATCWTDKLNVRSNDNAVCFLRVPS